MNTWQQLFILTCTSILLAGCGSTDWDPLTEGSTFKVTRQLDSGDQGKLLTVKEWNLRNGTTYRDRNGDGIADWRMTKSGAVGVYSLDDDFDGDFDREVRKALSTGAVESTEKISEPVSAIHEQKAPSHTYQVQRN